MNQNPTNPVTEQSQWIDVCLTVRNDLKLSRRKLKGKSVVLIEDPVSGKFFQFGRREFVLIQSLDGARSIDEANTTLADEHGLAPLSPGKLKEFFDWLVRNNLVESGAAVHVGRFENANRRKQQQELTQFFNPFYFRVPMLRPDAALQRMVPFFGWLFSKAGLMLWLTIISIAGYQLLHHFDQFRQTAGGIFSGWQWIWLVVAGLMLKVIHECGHGIACRKFGAEVRETGIVLMCFMPLAYIDVTTSWRLQNKWQRITISLAGMFVELMVAAVAVIVWSLCPETVVGMLCYHLALMASFTTLLFNANPLMRFDGYYALSDLLEMPNLYARAGQQVNRFVSGFFFGSEGRSGNVGGLALLIYGLLTLWWRVLICIGLALVATFMFHGAGIVLAAIGILFWIVAPFLRTVRSVKTAVKGRRIKLSRWMLAGATSILLAIAGITWLSRPAVVTAHGIVEFAPLTIIRAEGPGFVKEIRTLPGEFVESGETIAVLENRELHVRLERLQHELAQAEIRMRDYQRKSEHSLTQGEEKTIESLREQVDELKIMVDALEVTAPNEGFVIRRNLSELVGVYLEEGDEIAVIGNPSEKELLISIDQADVVGLQQNLLSTSDGNPQAAVLAAGHKPFSVQFSQIDPRGSRTPIHPSLCVTNGGSLPVTVKPANGNSDGKESVELLSPGFTAKIKLSPEQSKRLTTGQRIQLRVRTNAKTRGVQVYESMRDWWRTQIGYAK